MFFFFIILAGCSSASGNHNKELEKSFSSAIKEKSVEEIDLNSLIDFDWEKAYLINPYTSQEMINEQLGFKYKDPSTMVNRDDIFLVVFIHNNKVVQYAELTSQFGSLVPESNDDYITPSNATIKIIRH
jgi:hypothetical protein